MKSLHRFFAISLLSLVTTFSVQAQTRSGNNAIRGTDSYTPPYYPYAGVSHFDPYTGNVHREIQDLEVWGGTGQISLNWMRYSNSRSGDFKYNMGTASNWNHSFQYDMSDDGINANGQAQILLHYPEGGEDIFTRDTVDLTIWLPLPGVGKRLFQDGTSFTLQTENGYQYHFEKLTDNSGESYYQLQYILDSQQNQYTLSYDTAKNLIQVAEPAGRYLSITYGTLGSSTVITRIASSDGRSVTYNYDVFNDGVLIWVRLISVDYGDGTQATYTYSQTAAGTRPNLDHALDPRSVSIAGNMKYTYDPNVEGFIKQEINGVSGEVIATLDASSANKSICYPNGRIQTYDMPNNFFGNLKDYTDGLGRKTQYQYDQNGIGFLLSVKDPLGRVTTFNQKTIYGNSLAITYPDGTTASWTRDDLDLILTYKDENRRVTTYTRDKKHRIIRIDYPDESFETFTYNSLSEVLDHQRLNGGIEHSNYDSRGLKTSFTDALGNPTTYTYNSADQLASIKDALGNTTSYEYNERGLLIKEIYADGSFKAYAYDTFGNQMSFTNEIGKTWTILFDEFRRPIKKTDPLNRITQYNYDLPDENCRGADDSDEPTKIILPSGRTTENTYDVEWQKTQTNAGVGSADEAITSYEYDLAGNLHMIIDPLGNQRMHEYDLRDRKISTTDALGNKTQWTYDEVGNILKVIRPENRTTGNEYDKMNRLKKTTDPRGGITKFEYDAEGNMTRLTNANGSHYNFEYDLLNRRTEMIYPGSKATFESYTYDAVGNLTLYINRDADDLRRYTYDNRNRETYSTWHPANRNHTPSITRIYDPASRLLSMLSDYSSLTYTYDDANEMTSETQDVKKAKATETVSYTYNADGLRSTITYPGGTKVVYNYTARNQVSFLSANGTRALVRYQYDLNGNRINKALENGTGIIYTYDDVNRMLSLEHQKSGISFLRFDYGYDAADRRTFVKRDNDKGDVFSYDATDQLTDVQYDATNPDTNPIDPLRIVNYELDSMGNRIQVTDNGVVTSYTTNGRDEYTEVGDSVVKIVPNGQIRAINGWTYYYNSLNQLTKAKKGSTTAVFKYDPLNRCVKRTFNGVTTFYYYDQWNLIEERDFNSNQIISQYIDGVWPDEILKRSTLGSPIYYYHDGLSNVMQLRDSSGAVAEKYSYDIFGAPTIEDSDGNVLAASAVGNRFMFAGREFIPQIGLYDFRSRVYAQELGRFIQTIPLRLWQGDINLYRYAFNNPANRVDHEGESVQKPPSVMPPLARPELVPIRKINPIEYSPADERSPLKDQSEIAPQ